MEKDGASVFNEDVYITEDHQKWLSEKYFPIVIGVNRYPRYINSRSVDPYVKTYLDENGIEEQPAWSLPVPNQEAAYKSLSKYAKDVLPMSDKQIKAMNIAWEWTSLQFSPYMGGARIRTVEEVVSELDMNTSSGYPFNNLYSKKKELFNSDPKITEFLEKDWGNLTDPGWTFIFTNSLKEEIRPDEKTRANKIRTFCSGAVDGTVHGNRLFADMNEKMNAGYLRSSSGVGMSPLKGNWDALYRKLNIFKNGYALDESEYDSSLRAYMMWACARLRWQQLRPEDQTEENLMRLKVYYRNLINSLIITPEGVIVMKLGGNPSGSCNTINDNTLILYALLAFAWIMNCGSETVFTDENQKDYLEFELNTAKILVGDDNTWTVSDWAHRFYNGKTIISTWNDIGVTTTTDSLEPRVAAELDFLSAKTIFYRGKAIPVYDRTKLMTSLLYAETKSQSPAYSLLRAAALLQVGWSDIQFRRFSRDYIAWLLHHFDAVCAQDQDWIQAKCAILTDQRLEDLFLGETLFPQSFNFNCDDAGVVAWFNYMRNDYQDYQETKERLMKPDKRSMSQPQASKKNRSRRGKGAKATRQQPKRSNNPRSPNFMGPMPQGKRAKKPRPPRAQQGPGRQGRNLAGKGSVRNFTTNRKCMYIEEDEYIGEVTGGSTAANFNTKQYPVNIGQLGTFPWGANVVRNNFEKYQFEYLEFYYKREVSEFATNGTTGKVMLHFDSDASDAPPTTKQQVEDTDPHVDGMPCENFKLVIPKEMLQKMKDGWFIRPAGLPGASDIKTYDIGNLYVSTQGLASNNAVVGELHVRYRCKCCIPILESASIPTNNSISEFQTTSAETVTSTVSTDVLFATPVANPLGVVNTAGVFNLPVGNYLVNGWVLFTDSVSEAVVVHLAPQKNGNNIVVGTQSGPQFVTLSSGEADTLPFSFLYSSNGTTDALTISVNATGTAGTLKVQGLIDFVAL